MSDKAKTVDRVLAVIGGMIGGVATGLFVFDRWLRRQYGLRRVGKK